MQEIAEHQGEVLKPLSAQGGQRLKARKQLQANKSMVEYSQGQKINENVLVMSMSGTHSPKTAAMRQAKFSHGPSNAHVLSGD